MTPDNSENIINSSNPYMKNSQKCLNLASIRGKIQFAKVMLTEAEFMSDNIRINPMSTECNVPQEALDAFAQSLDAAMYEIQQAFSMIKLNSVNVKS